MQKGSQPEESIKTGLMLWYCTGALYRLLYITKSLQMSEETNNSIYKLTTDKIQLQALINVLIRSFLNLRFHSVAMHLECGGIFNDR